MRLLRKLDLILLLVHLVLVSIYFWHGVACVSTSLPRSTADTHGERLEKQKAIIKGDTKKFLARGYATDTRVKSHRSNTIGSLIYGPNRLSRDAGHKLEEARRTKLNDEHRKRQMIAPGFYQAECSEKKPCKKGTYCNVLYCEECHKINVGCTMDKQCCEGLVCTFGRCEKNFLGHPGTFCSKDSDCKDGCCVLEPTINSHLPICKRTLEEYHQCAAILFRKIWVGEKPDCGPCKPGLECVQKGVLGSHEVCMKPQ